MTKLSIDNVAQINAMAACGMVAKDIQASLAERDGIKVSTVLINQIIRKNRENTSAMANKILWDKLEGQIITNFQILNSIKAVLFKDFTEAETPAERRAGAFALEKMIGAEFKYLGAGHPSRDAEEDRPELMGALQTKLAGLRAPAAPAQLEAAEPAAEPQGDAAEPASAGRDTSER